MIPKVVVLIPFTNLLKLIGLMLLIAAVNVVVFSPGLMAADIGGSAFETAAGVSILFVSVLVLIYGSYTLLAKPPASVPLKEIRTHEDYVAALRQFENVRALRNDITLALSQLDRIVKKKAALASVLGQRFDPAELSYKKFDSVIEEISKLLYLNIRGILNKLNAFTASDVAALGKASHISNRWAQEKVGLFKEYVSYVHGYLGVNEDILLKLDKLMLEISLLGSTDVRDVDDMPCVKEIDLLIKQTKLYKQ